MLSFCLVVLLTFNDEVKGEIQIADLVRRRCVAVRISEYFYVTLYSNFFIFSSFLTKFLKKHSWYKERMKMIYEKPRKIALTFSIHG